MRAVILTACSLVTLGLMGFACDNDPNQLPTGATTGAGGDTTSSSMGGDNTTSANGGSGNTGNEGGAGGDMSTGGNGGAGGTVVITDCVEDLNPQEVGHNDIIISEISIGNYIEVYNDSNETKSLGGIAYQEYLWCARPNYPGLQTTAVGISLPPGAYRTIPWPTITTVTNADGEIALYDAVGSPAYTNEVNVMDFVCWGNGNTATRKDVAEAAGEWGAAAPCAASTTNGVITRLTGNSGDVAASWDSTATADPTNCNQP